MRVLCHVFLEDLPQDFTVRIQEVLDRRAPELALAEPLPILERSGMPVYGGKDELDALHKVELRVFDGGQMQQQFNVLLPAQKRRTLLWVALRLGT